jgi:hypothetical protein
VRTAIALTLLLAVTAIAASPPRPPLDPRWVKLKEEAEPYRAFAEQMVLALGKGDAKTVRARWAAPVGENGAKAIDDAFSQAIVPYFATFDKLDPDLTALTRTQDKDHKGFVVQMVFFDTAGERKPVLIYVVKVNDAFTIANIIPGHSLDEASRIKPQP